MEDVMRIAIMLISIGFSVIFHEMSHAWSALKMGDPTGKNDNRLSWNPIHHIDPMMTIFLPVILLTMSGGRFAFGGAKPVQINPMNFKNPGKGMMISAAMGPLSNYLLSAVSFGLLFLLFLIAPKLIIQDGRSVTLGGFFLLYMMYINLLLGSFNLVPIPPLDGSRVLRYLLPKGGQKSLDRIEPFGLFILVILLVSGALWTILGPIADLCLNLFWAAFGREEAILFGKVLGFLK